MDLVEPRTEDCGRCDGCGYVGPWELGLTRVRSRRTERVLCPPCEMRRREVLGYLAIPFQFAVVVGLFEFEVLRLPADGGEWVAVYLLSVLAFSTMVLIHELGHALVAALLGFRVFVVSLGGGRPLVDAQVGRTTLRLHRSPFGGGLTVASSSRAGWYRARLGLMLLGGVTANAVSLVVLVHYWSAVPPELHIPVLVFAAASVSTILASLRPRLSMSTMGPSQNDGALFLRAMRMGPDDVRQEVDEHDAHAVQFGRSSPPDTAGVDETLRADPTYREAVALRLLQDAEPVQALAVFDRVGQLPSHWELRQKVLLASRWASAIALAGRRDRLEEADHLSAWASKLLPWDPEVQAARGWALLEQDEPGEATALFKQAKKGLQEREHQRSSDAGLALAYLDLGDLRQARRHARDLLRCADGVPYRERVLDALAAAEVNHLLSTLWDGSGEVGDATVEHLRRSGLSRSASFRASIARALDSPVEMPTEDPTARRWLEGVGRAVGIAHPGAAFDGLVDDRNDHG